MSTAATRQATGKEKMVFMNKLMWFSLMFAVLLGLIFAGVREYRDVQRAEDVRLDKQTLSDELLTVHNSLLSLRAEMADLRSSAHQSIQSLDKAADSMIDAVISTGQVSSRAYDVILYYEYLQSEIDKRLKE